MTAKAQQKPLWSIPIPVLGLTGEFSSGKTLFGLTIDPAHTLVYDEEKSSESYTSLGFTRIDLFAEVSKKHPTGMLPVHVFEWWLQHVRGIKPGEFRVIMLDTVGTIESGLADWVEAHPEQFGKTRAQYLKISALMWGDVKEYWKLILSELATKCETFVFTSHMGEIFSKDGQATGKRKPKGKTTLKELASLYLEMERKANSKGEFPAKPSAKVLKHRLMGHRLNAETGEIEIVPLVPPRLPVATPHALRQYMLTPPDYSRLTDEEKVHPDELSAEDRLGMELAKSQADRDTEALKLERMNREDRKSELKEQAKGQSRSANVKPTHATAPSANGTPEANGVAHNQAASATAAPSTDSKISDEQLAKLVELRQMADAAKSYGPQHRVESTAAWKETLRPYEVMSAKDLSRIQAAALIEKLEAANDPFSAGQKPVPQTSTT